MALEQNEQYVFLVDDEPIQNEMLKDHISSKYQFKLKTYDSGEAMIKDINLNPRIIVLDFHLNSHLPNAQNGVEVLKKVKELNPQSEVIMLSGQDKLEVAVESMKHGAYDYVIKGETAFSRMENILDNILELHSLKATNKTYKTIVALLGVAILLVLMLSVFLVMKLDATMPSK